MLACMPRKRVDWQAVQAFYDAGNGRDACMLRFGFTLSSWYKAIRHGLLRAQLKRRRIYDWAAVQRFYDEGNDFNACRRRFGFASASWTKAVARGELRSLRSGWPLERVLRFSQSRSTVKRALLREGVFTNRCDICGITEWQGRPLSMQLDHINGARGDHRVENLRMLCPNCHSQTETFGSRNRKGTGPNRLGRIPR